MMNFFHRAMITVAGLGVAGSYLLRRLSEAGFDAEGYDPKYDGFYIPCGYATNAVLLERYLSHVGMKADAYIRSKADKVILSGAGTSEIYLNSIGLCTVDKNALEQDMIAGMKFERRRAPVNSAGITVDATGVSRYYLGSPKNDFTMFTKEYLTDEAEHQDFYFRYFDGGRGYFWEFPLMGKFHVGAGADSLDLIDDALAGMKYEKVLSRRIRLKPLFDEITRGNIIGIGEAIGTVSPITGEGILPSMESAEILFQVMKKCDDPEEIKLSFSKEIRTRFQRFPKLFDLLVASRDGNLRQLKNLAAIKYVKEDFRNFGIDLKIGKVLLQLVT